jgi:ABC-type transport system substrate-binding protein
VSHTVLRSNVIRGFAVALAFGLIVTACGGGDDSGSGDRETGERSNVTVAPQGEAKPGGKVTYGLEAETDGWDPWANRWAASGVQVGLTFYDTMAAFDADGVAQPYLAESFTPNDDFTQWDIKLREGISFTNGTPLTSEAVVNQLTRLKESILTNSAVGPMIDVVVVDDLTARVNMSQPWAVFPSVLTAQAGVVPAPDVTPEELQRNPVGTGPFIMTSWEPDKSLVVEKNDDYWREGLPYLDEVEFQPIPEVTTRFDSLVTGDIQMMYTTSSQNVVQLREAADNGELQVVEDQGENEESLVLLNTAEGILSDVRLREAIALATDRQQVVDITAEGIHELSTGPFHQASAWFADSGYPEEPDIAAATELVDEWKAENGGEAPNVTLITTNVTENIETIGLLAQQWIAAGFEVQEETTDQQTLISNAIGGTYEAQLWKQFGSADPDLEYHWWYGDGLLNFARNNDPEINDALDDARASDDVETRKEDYAIVQERMTELFPYIWLYETIGAVGAATNVRGITNGPLPSGEPSLPMGGTFPGDTYMTQVWLDD